MMIQLSGRYSLPSAPLSPQLPRPFPSAARSCANRFARLVRVPLRLRFRLPFPICGRGVSRLFLIFRAHCPLRLPFSSAHASKSIFLRPYHIMVHWCVLLLRFLASLENDFHHIVVPPDMRFFGDLCLPSPGSPCERELSRPPFSLSCPSGTCCASECSSLAVIH